MEVLTVTKDMQIKDIILDSQKLLADSQQSTTLVLQRICNIVNKQDEMMNSIVKEQDRQKESISQLEKNTNVICSPFHSKRKRDFVRICKTRVWYLFGGKDNTPEYVLFSHYLFKKIYGDIAKHFDLDSWHDISMENYEDETSMYSKAKTYAQRWTPSDWYINECIRSMIDKRDMGYLSPERCRALTEYLKITNNGEINPFHG